MDGKEQQADLRWFNEDWGGLLEHLFCASVLGKENIPKSGPFLVAITHDLRERTLGKFSFPKPPLDVIFVSRLIEEATGQNIRWMVADFHSVALGLPLPARQIAAEAWRVGTKRYGGIPVPLDKREMLGRGKAAMKAIDLLTINEIIGVALSLGKKLSIETIEKGAAYIALGTSKRTGEPTKILPIQLKGFEDPVRVLLNRHSPVKVKIFKPILASFDLTRDSEEQIGIITARLLSLLSGSIPDIS
ncbi:MAG: hypothetical protein PHX72_01740 [Candidatus Shapirobacteria bacterium]|nr:hypothetical protein [Candidatus Shapirobacteria bacterium]